MPKHLFLEIRDHGFYRFYVLTYYFGLSSENSWLRFEITFYVFALVLIQVLRVGPGIIYNLRSANLLGFYFFFYLIALTY